MAGTSREKKYCCDNHRRLAGKRKAKVAVESTSDKLISDEEMKFRRDLERGAGKIKILFDALEPSIRQIDPNQIKSVTLKKSPKSSNQETMVCLISDCHMALVTDSYNIDIAVERGDYHINRILRIFDIITGTIPIKKIVLIFLGDVVAGQDIYPAQAYHTEAIVMQQIYSHASPFVIKMIKSVAELVPKVVVHMISGNHGRTGKDVPREVNFDNILAMDIRRRFETHPRVKVNVYWQTKAIVSIEKRLFLITHGDLIRQWFNIPIYGLVNKGMRWQGAIEYNWSYMVHGHFHTALKFSWNNFQIIGNGCYPTGDTFAMDQLGMASLPVQQVFGVHPEHGITWDYWINLDKEGVAFKNVELEPGIQLPPEPEPLRLDA
jgi:hypothetical protein